MKKLLIFLAFVIAAMTVNAQGKIKNNSYFNLQYAVPTGNYGLVKDSTGENLHKAFFHSKVSEVTYYAGGLQFGANFYLPFLEGFKPGVTCDFIDLNFHYYKFKPDNKGDNPNSDLLFTYSLNVGVIGTISPCNNLFIDLYGKLVPTFGINYMKLPAYTSSFEDKVQLAMSTSSKFNDEEQATVYGLNYVAGFGLRYNIVQIGAEFLFGNLTYNYENWASQKLSNKMFRFKLGMFFD